MVKRGNRILEGLTYHNPINDNHEIKKFMWLCETCNTEYYFKNEALICESNHKPKLETYKEFRERLTKKSQKIKEFKKQNRDLENKEFLELKALRDNQIITYQEYEIRLIDHYKKFKVSD